VFGAAGIMILEVLGISIIPVIASAGVLSLAIGFGAQSVVEDLLRGLFMLAEDQFGVGDRIDIGHVNGYIERVTLRTVVIRDPAGTLWHVPNSQIDWVANENQIHSRATVLIGVSYDADLEQATRVLDDAARTASTEVEWRDRVQGEPQVQGVQELGDDAVILRVIVWVDAPERRRFERHLRRRLKEALDGAAIEMPNRQVDIWLRQHGSIA
jgi:small conductance mechanosensitive channel